MSIHSTHVVFLVVTAAHKYSFDRCAFGMFSWAHAVVRNNFQKHLSDMLEVKNALLQSAVIYHLKYLSFSKLNASVTLYSP